MKIHSSTSKSGYTALLSFILLIVVWFVPANGAEYFAAIGLFMVGVVCSWFWWKGLNGTEKDRLWVDNNW